MYLNNITELINAQSDEMLAAAVMKTVRSINHRNIPELVTHPHFGLLTAATCGLLVSRSGILPKDVEYQRVVTNAPFEVKVACELALYWYFDDGETPVSAGLKEYSQVCQSVKTPTFLEVLVKLSQEDLEAQLLPPSRFNKALIKRITATNLIFA